MLKSYKKIIDNNNNLHEVEFIKHERNRMEYVQNRSEESMKGKSGVYYEYEFPGTAYTIEYHLKMYADAEYTTERHQVLWHAWNQNKRWLTQLLEWTLPSFPTYSYHNATHADTVLHNIERILGEDRIHLLSASDCFMLLHAVYMHDIGMSISSSERNDMMQDEKFIDLIEHLEKEGDPDMKKAAESVLQSQYITHQGVTTKERAKKLKELFQQKLDVYYGLSQIMAEYQRRQHAEKVKDRMHKWTMDAEKLGNGFSVSGIPLRIFLRIADCASIHTSSGIEPVLKLPREDSGYVLDMLHPRFVAVMLQLGDALDMDNDRFNPFVFQFAGGFPRTSTLHFKKHQAIRQLKITPEAIQIQADCDSQDVLRLVRMECEAIEEILKNASYYWSNIAPEGFSGCLPTLNQSAILLDGQRVPKELVKAQFNISQVRAFKLLEGANVYGGNFVFLREVIQNAIDASKLQCWEDYIYHSKLKERKILQDSYEIVEYGLNASEKEILSEIDVWEYPIEIYFEIGVQIRNKEEEIEFVPLEKMTEEHSKEKDYGVRVTVRDHGTGISKEDLIKISNVGSSYEEKRHFIDKMPDWLKPTGQFGIGLQSAFLVSDSMTARTYTRSGEKYEITFNKVSNGSGGYINVKPLPPEVYVTFGTTLEIFIHYKHKRPHADCWEAWNTESEDADRFVSDYDPKRPIRHSQEMLAQMIIYIDSMLGENLFPIYACIRGKGCDNKQYAFIKRSITKLVLEQQADGVAPEKDIEKQKYISWLFKAIRPKEKQSIIEGNREQLVIVDIKDGIGALDCSRAKLYIWNNILGVFAQFGGGRMLSNYSRISDLQEVEEQDKKKTRIYLKGIFLQSHSMYQDSELLEIIDIKGGKIGRSHIAINRNAFTKEGLDYLEQEIYPAIISSAKAALVELNEQAILEEEKWQKRKNESTYFSFDIKIMNSILAKTQNCIEKEKGDFTALKLALEETVLSAIGLSYFMRVLGKEKKVFCEKPGKMDNICKWDDLLNHIVRFRWEGKMPPIGRYYKASDNESNKFDRYINCGMMHKMKVYLYKDLKRGNLDGEKGILDYASLLLEKRKVGIISIRHNKYSRWFYIPMLIYEEKGKEVGNKEDSESSESGESQENAFEIFQIKARTAQEEQDLLQRMEHWADGIFNLFNDLAVIQNLHEEYGVDSDIQYTLNYMLGNIPTVALYTDGSEDGNVRINVLSAEGSSSIFFNKYMKRLILKKVDNLYQRFHAKRFITTVWRSYECLALQEIPSSVCVANGAYIAKQQTNRMLLPILGESMAKLLHLKEQDFYKEINTQKEHCEKLKGICNDIFNFRSKFSDVMNRKINGEDLVEREIDEYLQAAGVFDGNVQMEYAEVVGQTGIYWRELNQYVKRIISQKKEIDKYKEYKSDIKIVVEGIDHSPKENKEYEYLYLEEHIPNKSLFQRMIVEEFFENIGGQLKNEQSVSEEEREAMWDWLLKAINFIDQYKNLDLQEWVTTHPSMERFKRSLWGKVESEEEVKKNMIGYVLKHTQEGLSEKQIINCYEKMIDDMIECILEDETEQNNGKNSIIEALF